MDKAVILIRNKEYSELLDEDITQFMVKFEGSGKTSLPECNVPNSKSPSDCVVNWCTSNGLACRKDDFIFLNQFEDSEGITYFYAKKWSDVALDLGDGFEWRLSDQIEMPEEWHAIFDFIDVEDAVDSDEEEDCPVAEEICEVVVGE